MKQDERTGDSTEALRSALERINEALYVDENTGEWRLPAAFDANFIDAALSSSPPPSTEGLREWQPIETAPRDGTEILTFSDRIGLGTMVLYWADGYWREKANGLGLKYGPTHWMPLPPAPDAARTALAGVTAPTTRSFNEHMVEDLIVAAYKRGFIWANHNPVDGEFLDKAARDYADYTMNGPTVGTGAATSTAGVTAPETSQIGDKQ